LYQEAQLFIVLYIFMAVKKGVDTFVYMTFDYFLEAHMMIFSQVDVIAFAC